MTRRRIGTFVWQLTSDDWDFDSDGEDDRDGLWQRTSDDWDYGSDEEDNKVIY
jgi:hypothetical protein